MRRNPLVDAFALGILVGAAVVVVIALAGFDAWAWQTLAIALAIAVLAALLVAFGRWVTARRPARSRRA